jgi:hypothetical protein
MAERGNHKSTKTGHTFLQSILLEEVQRGWQLPLPKGTHLKIPRSVLGPLGLAHQTTIDEQGHPMEKKRLTHDQSSNVVPTKHRSVNNRVIHEELTPCRYGSALIRFNHFIVDLRLKHPNSRILLTKADLKAAYRRMHNDPEVSVQSMITFEDLGLLALRLTFGGSPNPSRWSDLAELACDLTNDLVRSSWDPSEFKSPHEHLLPDEPGFLPDNVPVVGAKPMAVPQLEDDQPRGDVFIDDSFCGFLTRDLERGKSILPFIIWLPGRPVSDDEPIPRDDVLSLKKFIEEATPSSSATN